MKRPKIRCSTCNQDIYEFMPTRDEVYHGMIIQASYFRGVGPTIANPGAHTPMVCPFCGSSLKKEMDKAYYTVFKSKVLIGDWDE